MYTPNDEGLPDLGSHLGHLVGHLRRSDARSGARSGEKTLEIMGLNCKKGEPSFGYDRSKSIVRKVKKAKVLIGPN